MSAAIWAVRILRRLPRTGGFDSHLDGCAALYMFRELGEPLSPLSIVHVFRLVPLPRLHPSRTNPMVEGAELAGIGAGNVVSLRRAPMT